MNWMLDELAAAVAEVSPARFLALDPSLLFTLWRKPASKKTTINANIKNTFRSFCRVPPCAAACLLLVLKTLKGQYTVADLDALTAEEKQAWLEVCEEQEKVTSAGVADQARLSDSATTGTAQRDKPNLGTPCRGRTC